MRGLIIAVACGLVLGWLAHPLKAQAPPQSCYTNGTMSDHAEAAAEDIAEVAVWLSRGGERPTGEDPQVMLAAQAGYRTLCFLRQETFE